jgi:hypothetical protein
MRDGLRLALPLSIIASVPVGCYGGFREPTVADDGTTGVAFAAPQARASTTAGSPGADGTAGDSSADESSTTSAELPQKPPAKGVRLARIEANQGTAIVLFDGSDDGGWIAASQRNADLIHGRRTLFRAYWQLDPEFSPREIEAELVLEHADGQRSVLTDVLHLQGEPDDEELDTTFHWIAGPEEMTPGVRLSVAFYEVEGEPPLEPPTVAPRFPAKGTEDLGVLPDELVIKVVAIPLATPQGGVEPTVANRQRIESALMGAYPVQRVELSLREPVVLSDVLQTTDDGWNVLEDARESDNAEPNVYYHLLLDRDTCCADNGNFGWSGIGGVSGDDKQDASWGGRDAMTKIDGGGTWKTSTIIHELGHNHGRPHAPCGGVSGSDDDFPREAPYGSEAGIGVQGFNVVDDELYRPFGERDYKDIMSYCNPSWWSDYNWQNNLERTLTAWDREAPGHSQDTQWALKGRVGADGEVSWSLVRARGFVGETASSSVLDSNEDVAAATVWRGAMAERRPVYTVPISEGRGRFIGVPLGEVADFDRVDVAIGARRERVEPERVRVAGANGRLMR